MPQVTAVSIKKKGVNQKTGKEWTMYAVELNDGSKASGFDLVKVGEWVDTEKNGQYLNYFIPKDASPRDYPPDARYDTPEKVARNAPQAPPAHQNDENGVEETRRHLMQAANLQTLCIHAVENYVGQNLPEVARTAEQYQALIGQLFIYMSGRRTTDGVHWWSYVEKMPNVPLK